LRLEHAERPLAPDAWSEQRQRLDEYLGLLSQLVAAMHGRYIAKLVASHGEREVSRLGVAPLLTRAA